VKFSVELFLGLLKHQKEELLRQRIHQRSLYSRANSVSILSAEKIPVARYKVEEAINHFQQAVNLRPDFADAHITLARSPAAQGRKNEAERHYEEALRLMKSWNHTRPSP
jgi:tetratricopeptide (TPR) repeat protein